MVFVASSTAFLAASSQLSSDSASSSTTVTTDMTLSPLCMRMGIWASPGHPKWFPPASGHRQLTKLPVSQNMDLLLPGKAGVVNDCIGALEQVGRVVQRPLQVDLAHGCPPPPRSHQMGSATAGLKVSL